MCDDVRGCYTYCEGDAIVQCGNVVFIMFSCNVKVIPAWWWQKVNFFEVTVVLGLTSL